MKSTPIFFGPDLDTAWSVNPGCLTNMYSLAPLASGNYGTVAQSNYISGDLTGTDILSAQMFRQVNGSVRMLVFRKQNIDEYDSSGTKTNRGTSYSASTAAWSAAAWGNQIIACNYLNNTQSSTGAGFTDLASGSPKARYVAANLDHVMFADVDDGGSNVFSDMVWWCNLQDPATWAPNIGGDAGYIRLLQAPGPIRALVAYRDMFVAFKDNAIMVGSYIGPPYVFSWKMVSNKVGTIAPKSVVELDGTLYFLHTSGFYAFDGQTLRNVGLPVTQTFFLESKYCTSFASEFVPPDGTFTADGVSITQAAADDLEGIVWWKGSYYKTATSLNTAFCYGYNVRAGKWGRFYDVTSSGAASPACLVSASSVDIQDFKANSTARLLMIWNSPAGTKLKAIAYPATANLTSNAGFSTGMITMPGQGSQFVADLYVRTMVGSDALSASASTTYEGHNSEARIGTAVSTGTSSVNTELQSFNIRSDSRYVVLGVGFDTNNKQIVSGLWLEPPGGRR